MIGPECGLTTPGALKCVVLFFLFPRSDSCMSSTPGRSASNIPQRWFFETNVLVWRVLIVKIFIETHNGILTLNSVMRSSVRLPFASVRLRHSSIFFKGAHPIKLLCTGFPHNGGKFFQISQYTAHECLILQITSSQKHMTSIVLVKLQYIFVPNVHHLPDRQSLV